MGRARNASTSKDETALTPKKARNLILEGRAPEGLEIKGHLDLSGSKGLRHLPAGLAVTSLDLTGCTALEELPAGLRARRITLNGCTALKRLPAGLSCYELELRQTALVTLPEDLRVEYRLDLTECARLRALPPELKVGSLILRGCRALEELPEGLDVYFLDISGCINLRGWPSRGQLRVGRLNASGCAQLSELPAWMTSLAQLDVSGCESLAALPPQLAVSSWIDLADTRIASLPEPSRRARLRWHGVEINERIAFHPETITATEVLRQRNVEQRRVMMERLGYERFFEDAKAEVLDHDSDPGGARRLLKVPMWDDEDLVCVAVTCPSTGRNYILRVPPTTRTCRQAVAWIAGFDSADDYRPIMET